VIVGTIVVGPILTGIVVVGAVFASSTMKKRAEEDVDPNAPPTLINKIASKAKSIDEENHISETVQRVGHQTYTTMVELDKGLGVSATTGKIFASAKEVINLFILLFVFKFPILTDRRPEPHHIDGHQRWTDRHRLGFRLRQAARDLRHGLKSRH
jgi:hypothetical protein